MAMQWTRWRLVPLTVMLLASGLTGCAALTPLETVPAGRLPPTLLAKPRADKLTIDFARLRQDPPSLYKLDSRDVLGIFIEGVLGTAEQAPPVNISDDGSVPPAIGFPIPVREDGTVSVPLVPPIEVKGLTLAQAEDKIRRAYTVDNAILRPGSDRIIVTLLRRRTYQVIVVREDSGNMLQTGVAGLASVSRRGQTFAIDLPAYENDILHALSETGGLPGLDAKNELVIIRGGFKDAEQRDKDIAEIVSKASRRCGKCAPEILEDENVIRIPIRYDAYKPPVFDQEDIILKTGDIVYIETRERDVFYTGGLLAGGEFPLPRDYDLDVLGAIAIAGGEIAPGVGARRQSQFFGQSIGPLFPPTEVVIIRSVPGCGEVAIRVDLNGALASSGERILIQSGDVVILKFTTPELIGNVLLQTINVQFLFNGFNRRF